MYQHERLLEDGDLMVQIEKPTPREFLEMKDYGSMLLIADGTFDEFVVPSGVKILSLVSCKIKNAVFDKDLVCVEAKRSKISNIAVGHQLSRLICPDCHVKSLTTMGHHKDHSVDLEDIDVRNNNISDISFKLRQKHVLKCRISGNNGIKIKHLDFIFDMETSDPWSLEETDVLRTLTHEPVTEYRLYRLFECIKNAHEYIDVDALFCQTPI
jgi:hypothetical protein